MELHSVVTSTDGDGGVGTVTVARQALVTVPMVTVVQVLSTIRQLGD